jgi:hypothetical protein
VIRRAAHAPRARVSELTPPVAARCCRGTEIRSNSIGFRGSIYFNPAFHTLGPNGEVIAHFNHAQLLALIPY